VKLFTFIIERAGGTYCSQHSGESYQEAAAAFVEYASSSKFLNYSSLDKTRLLEDVLEATPLTGLVNISCFSHIDGSDEFWFANVVETAMPGVAAN